MIDINSIPTSIFAFSIGPYLCSEDLFSLRACSRSFNTVLHCSDESEELWKQALARDFQLNDGDYLKTLRISKENSAKRKGASLKNRFALSVFGYTATESIFEAESAFVSWKHWKKASKIYYDCLPQTLPRSDDIFLSANPGEKGQVAENINGPFFLRAARIWATIERWCDSQQSGYAGQQIKGSLAHGVSYMEGRFHKLPDHCDRKGAHAMEAIYAFHNGQKMGNDISSFAFKGLLGGYSVYHHRTCTTLLDNMWSDRIRRYRPGEEDYMPIAASFGTSQKIISLHIPSGQVVIDAGCHRRRKAVNLATSKDSSEYLEPCYDTALNWLEEFVSRLRCGQIGTGNYGSDSLIVQYPMFPSPGMAGGPNPVPITSRAVTRGISVISSSVFAPELVGVAHIYSIRIKLLTVGEDGYETPKERGFKTCQLRSRHWKLRDHVNNLTDEVEGDGVVGMYPLLEEGGYRDDKGEDADNVEMGDKMTGLFVYQSCSGPIQGSFCGHIQFVPGSLDKPSGDVFDVEVAPFALEMNPKFLF